MLSLVSGKFEVMNYFVILTVCVLAARPVIFCDRSSFSPSCITWTYVREWGVGAASGCQIVRFLN